MHNFAFCIVIFSASWRIDLYILNYLVSVSERAKCPTSEVGQKFFSTPHEQRKNIR